MGRISAKNYKPHLSFRYEVQFSKLSEAKIYAKGVTLPQVNNNPIEISYGNVNFKVKGKTTWDSIQLQLYAYEEITFPELYTWFGQHHQESSGTDGYHADYVDSNVKIKILDPQGAGTGSPITTFTLIDAFIDSISWGQLDWEGDGIIQADLTIAYDYAEVS